MHFKSWVNLEEASYGYILAGYLFEGRKNPEALRQRKGDANLSLFSPEKEILDPQGCAINPLSGYKKQQGYEYKKLFN